VSAYRFCRTDDIGLLVDALNRCWAPSFPGDPPMTPAAFKRSIRDLQVWCSSCMVAFAGADPIGVLIGAKRPFATLIHRIAVHPEHQRQGHGRHLLVSLSSKLAILGPPRIVSEVVATNAAARELFRASGYVEETTLTDYVWEGPPQRAPSQPGYVIPVTLDDLAANGLLGDATPPTPWERSIETLTARKDEIDGLAVASEERIEAYVLYVKHERKILLVRSCVDDGGSRVSELLRCLGPAGPGAVLPKVHPAELSGAQLHTLGFRPAATHLLYAANAASH
jgi:GNAT superfamily N-acetyltransferase